MERRIAKVENCHEKQETYQEQMRRYSKAIKEGFYYEALLIDYAVIEDRLWSFLYHAAFFCNREGTSCWKKTKKHFQSFVEEYKKQDENPNLSVGNLSGKIRVVRSMLLWASESDASEETDRYVLTLKNQLEGLDIAAILDALEGIEQWKGYRNEIVHGLLNKKRNAVDQEMLEQLAKDGMKYAREIDSQLKILKRGNRVRKVANAPIED